MHNRKALTRLQGQGEYLGLAEIFFHRSSVSNPVDRIRRSLSAASYLYV
jgi:hypothetical protein